MTTESFKKLVKWWLIVIAILIFGVICITIGRHQAKNWDTTNTHLKMEHLGYNYCPYCGKSIEEGK